VPAPAAAKDAESEIAEIEKTMRTDRKAYNADVKMQQRYRELLEARPPVGKELKEIGLRIAQAMIDNLNKHTKKP
jgi:hypothetical protein